MQQISFYATTLVMENLLNKVEHSEPVEQSLVTVRHFKDTEDLRNSRDCCLESKQEENVEKVSKGICEDFLRSNSKAIFLSTSSKKRALETAYLIKDSSSRVINRSIKIKNLKDSWISCLYCGQTQCYLTG